MRVALVSPTWPPETSANGIVTYVGALRSGLEQLGEDVRVLAGRVNPGGHQAGIVDLKRSGETASRLERARRNVHRLVAGEDFARAHLGRLVSRAVRGLAPTFAPDVLEMEESLGSVELVARKTRVPVVVRLHGPWFLNGAALGVARDRQFRHRVACEGRAIARAQAISSPSRDLLERVRSEYGLALGNAVVIPNPSPRVDPEARWSLASCDPNLVLFVGRFDRHKGGDLVVDAFCELARLRPQLELAFIGPDRGLRVSEREVTSLADYVARRAPDQRVRDRIRHLGQRPSTEIAEWRRRARATVVASRFEVFGMVAVEALAFGCPLVAPRAGAIPELVRHDETGLLFPNESAGELARALATLLDRPDLSARLGARAAADAATRFAPDAVARQTRDYYREAIAAQKGDGARTLGSGACSPR